MTQNVKQNEILWVLNPNGKGKCDSSKEKENAVQKLNTILKTVLD